MKRIALHVLYRLMLWRFGQGVFENWAWEDTPYPFGPPSWKDVRKGFKLVLKP